MALARVGVWAAAAAMAVVAPAWAQEMKPEEARRFVAGKLFTYTCFDGTTGMGRINADGSVTGTMRQGSTPARFVVMPAGTVRVKGGAVCASVKGMYFEPCFQLTKTSDKSFRGAVSGLGFAYCDFVRRGGRTEFARASLSRSAERPRLRPALATTAGE